MRDYKPIEKRLLMGNDTFLTAVGKGNLMFRSTLNGRERTFLIQDILFCEDMRCNLISGSMLDRNGVRMLFGGGKCSISSSKGTLLAIGNLIRGLYRMEIEPIAGSGPNDHHIAYRISDGPLKPGLHCNQEERTLTEWHERLGHAGKASIKRLVNLSTGMIIKPDPSTDDLDCEACILIGHLLGSLSTV